MIATIEPKAGARTSRPPVRPGKIRADETSALRSGLPTNTLWFTRFFARYAEKLVRKNFHSVRILGAPDLSQFNNRPLVIYGNHPSWWDPMIGLVVWRRLLADRIPYTPIEAAMLRKYGFFKWLGFYGVEKKSISGARQFLRTSEALLDQPNTLLFITPQGRFADVRDTNVAFESGLSHLAARAVDVTFLPLAVEFTYWEEKRPEVLLRFGQPVNSNQAARAKDINHQLQDALQVASNRLAVASINRESDAFENLLQGNEGTNPVYDGWRRLKARLKGQTFTAAHGTK